MTVRTQPSRDLTDLSVRQDVGHDGERRDEADAHVPPEVGQEVVERVAELQRFFKKILIIEVYQRRLNSLPIHQGLNSKNTLQYKGWAAILDIRLKFKVEKGSNVV